MKRTKLAKKGKQKVSILHKKLWAIVSKRIKERDKNICFTSGKYVTGMNCHCGHGISNSISGGRLRFHPKNLAVQSYYENIHASGNGGTFYRNQVVKYGQETMDKLYALKNKYIKVDADYYLTLIDLYTNGSWQDIEDYLEI